MSICLKLKEDYLNEIKEMENKCRENAKRLSLEEAKDEAILENIKINVIDIFSKMFNISYNKSCLKGDEKENIKALKDAYFSFFDKIKAPWRIKMDKDKEHNMMEEYYKEKIKLEVAEDMKNSFIKHYDKIYKEN